MIPTGIARHRQTVMRCLHTVSCLLVAGLAGCATIVHGTTQTVPIVSNPAGARIAIDSVPIGTTPYIATLSRGRSHVVTLSRDSLPDVNVLLTRRMSGWIWGNMFLYYLPALIDFADGAAFKFNVDTVRIGLSDWAARDTDVRPGFAGLGRIRFVLATSPLSFVYARLDSLTAERIYINGAFDDTHRYNLPVVPRIDVMRMDIAVGMGRWAPWEAHRIGSPLLVDDPIRIRLAGSELLVEGQLITLDSSGVLITDLRGQTHFGRSQIASIARPKGYDFATGARRGAVVGAILGAIAGSQVKGSIVKPNGPNLMIGGAIGSVVGLLGTPAFAPRKWVDVAKW